MGIAKTARPEEDGTTKPSRKNSSIMIRMNAGPAMPWTALEDQNRSVSEIRPSSMIRLMPRARPMIRETPTSEDAPLMNAFTTVFSSVPEMNMMMIEMARNMAAICGNHQCRFMTPYTIRTKAEMKSTRMAFLRRLKPSAWAAAVSPRSTLNSCAKCSRSS